MQLRPRVIATVTVAAVYVAVAKFGFLMAFTADQVTLVWPPTGLSLAALIFFGNRIAPGIFLGALIANVTTAEPLLVATTIAAGNTTEALVAAALLRRYGGMTDSLDGLRHALVLLVGAAIFSTAISATIGVVSLCAGGVQPWTLAAPLWWTWWLGDATSDLLIAPLLLSWRHWPDVWRGGRLLEAGALLLGLGAITQAVFVGLLPAGLRNYPLEFMVFPFVIWAALRFGAPGTAVAHLVTAVVAVWGTTTAIWRYSPGEIADRLMLLQIFMGIVSGTGLLLGAAVTERQAAQRRERAEHAITQVLAGAGAADEAMRRILETICRVLDWDVGLFWQVDPEAQCLRCSDVVVGSRLGLSDFERASRSRTFEVGDWLPGRVWKDGVPMWIPDLGRDQESKRLRIGASEGLRAAFALPITVGHDVLGVVEFFSRSVRIVDADLLQMFASVGAELGQFLARKRVEREILDSEVRKAAMLEAAFDCIITADHRGRVVEFNPAAERILGYSRAEAVGRDMADLIVPQASRDGFRSELANYLATGQSSVVGRRIEIVATRADGREFPAELSMATAGSTGLFTGFLRDITSQKRMVNQLAFRASHDPLTKTLNRTAFLERLGEAARHSTGQLAILFVDLDHFKSINDNLGHLAGDRLLAIAAQRMRQSVRPGDALARLGGDEFAILLEAMNGEKEARAVADRVMSALGSPFLVDGREVMVTVSIGIAVGSAGVTQPEGLLGSADAAMYRAKAAGRARIEWTVQTT